MVSWHSSAAFLPNFWLFPSPRVQHCYKNTSQLNFLCSLPVLQFWWTFDGVAGQNLDLAPVVAAFFFDPSERNKVQEHFKITTQLIFLMPPTSPASFVQIGALWIFFVPRVPPLHHFSFLVAHTPTRCKQTSKSLPSLFFWWSPPVLQVLSRLEHFDFFLFQGYPLCIIFRFWSLRPQQGASKLQNHFPAYFFDGPHQSCKFCPDWRTLNFF